jgi:hypothetical protein
LGYGRTFADLTLILIVVTVTRFNNESICTGQDVEIQHTKVKDYMHSSPHQLKNTNEMGRRVERHHLAFTVNRHLFCNLMLNINCYSRTYFPFL